jgi:hypothetical protein
MAQGDIQKGDIGAAFILTIKDQDGAVVDVSGATTKQIKFLKPDGLTVLTKSAVFETDGTDGKIKYVTVSDDLDVAGYWARQGYVVMPGGSWHTDRRRFYVSETVS